MLTAGFVATPATDYTLYSTHSFVGELSDKSQDSPRRTAYTHTSSSSLAHTALISEQLETFAAARASTLRPSGCCRRCRLATFAQSTTTSSPPLVCRPINGPSMSAGYPPFRHSSARLRTDSSPIRDPVPCMPAGESAIPIFCSCCSRRCSPELSRIHRIQVELGLNNEILDY